MWPNLFPFKSRVFSLVDVSLISDDSLCNISSHRNYFSHLIFLWPVRGCNNNIRFSLSVLNNDYYSVVHDDSLCVVVILGIFHAVFLVCGVIPMIGNYTAGRTCGASFCFHRIKNNLGGNGPMEIICSNFLLGVGRFFSQGCTKLALWDWLSWGHKRSFCLLYVVHSSLALHSQFSLGLILLYKSCP